MSNSSSSTDSALTIHRSDYAPPAYWVDTVRLDVEILDATVTVHATLNIRPNGTGGSPLVFQGEELKTQKVLLDGVELGLDRLRIETETLTILNPPGQPFTVETFVVIDPWHNTSLSGLYKSGPLLCTQCEAEGFRRITWYPDRPDVMAKFTVAITADRTRYPILLSNGNLVDGSQLPNQRHRAVWEDPFPKPSYLFALVAGDLALVQGSFRTRSGRDVDLKFWVEHGNEDQVPHALSSLQLAMKWDEQVFGLEYDLDIFNVVAVSHFNMGAMENKSLNIFNSKYVLAKKETATDGDFLAIESVIAHEYFHNWTGNRVTCRDWFQLTLKEGLTVFRDQEFSADQGSRSLQRIDDVRALRGAQFPEDNGPMAHPIRPDSYQEINNFYTSTVYEKGAEVIRMIQTLIGPQAFRQGMDLYFARHDGHAVTCEDFVAAMEDASGQSLAQFRLWYAQAGTPKVAASWSYDAHARRFSLTLEQTVPPTPGQPDKQPMHIPVRLGLVGADGHDMAIPTPVVSLTQASQTFVFDQIPTAPIPSLFRGFSAPVIVDAPYSNDDLAFLMANDADGFNRWEAGQTLAAKVLLDQIKQRLAGVTPDLDRQFAAAWGKVLHDAPADPAYAVEALSLPSMVTLGERMEVFEVDQVYASRRATLTALAKNHRDELLALRDSMAEPEWSLTPTSIGKRNLRNLALGLLALQKDESAAPQAQAQFAHPSCMGDQLAALGALMELGISHAQAPLEQFLNQWRGENLVVNKWLAMQAGADWPDVLDRIDALTRHPVFDWSEPNKIYALLGAFTGNTVHFHRLDGAGYAFLADQIIRLDASNPQVASRMVRALIRWRRFNPTRQTLMKVQLQRIQSRPGLSRDVAEIVGKALA